MTSITIVELALFTVNLVLAVASLLYLSLEKNSTLATLLPADKPVKLTVALPLLTSPLKTLLSTVTLTVPLALLATVITATAFSG